MARTAFLSPLPPLPPPRSRSGPTNRAIRGFLWQKTRSNRQFPFARAAKACQNGTKEAALSGRLSIELGGKSVFSVEPTSTWIPLSLLAVLSAYMVHLFLQERRQALAGTDGVEATSMELPVLPPLAPVAAAPAPSETAPEKKKRRLLWRTAWLWLPFVAGFAGQAWLDIVKPMVEKAGI